MEALSRRPTARRGGRGRTVEAVPDGRVYALQCIFLRLLQDGKQASQAVGRIGCFFAGCCGGIETSAWFGVSFPANSLAWTTAKIIPTQLISSGGDFLIFFITYRILTKGKHPEDTAGWYLMLYSIGRFFIEFIRGDLIRGQIGIFSTSQVFALFTFLLGAYLIWRRQNKTEQPKEDKKA